MRGTLPHARLLLTVLTLVAAGLWALEAWALAPPTGQSRATVTAAVVGYELAPVPVWPAAYRGRRAFSAADRAALQRRADALMATYATGAVLGRWLGADRPASMLEDLRGGDGRMPIAARGRVVYYDFLRRTWDGRVVVRAAVEHTITSCRWSARSGAVDVDTRISPTVAIMDYTLAAVNGVWKVAGVRGWRFLDIAGGHITYDPPGGGATP